MFMDMINKGDGRLAETIRFLQSNKKPLVLFGASIAGESMLCELEKLGIAVTCFADNDEAKRLIPFCGYEVLSPSEVKYKYPGAVVIVSIGTSAAEQVKKQLDAMGCFESVLGYFYRASEFYDFETYVNANAQAFEMLGGLLADDKSREVLAAHINCLITGELVFPSHLAEEGQYFDDDIIRFKEGEVFLDAGSYDGGTALEFARRAPRYKKIICLEPEKENFERTVQNTMRLERVECFQLGAWERRSTFAFKGSGISSRMSDEGDYSIEVVSIDDMFSNEAITFIKMDIEGAEIAALKGARETIVKHRPRLAVCAYHKREDLLVIPLLLKSLNSDYRIYFRHYGPDIYETVCYAV